MKRSPLSLLLLGALLLLTSCFGQKVAGEADAVAKIVKSARKNGAYRCAPKELALAEAHLLRTRNELDLGNYVPASRHIVVARANAKLAFKNSPPEKCAPKVVVNLDSDGDGCPDKVDKCPHQPEDKDGFKDDDCCPDPDNDEDGIADKVDKCPNLPEDKDGYQDSDGCPDKYKLVVVTQNKIELKQKVYFATARTRILARSFRLLNEVGSALKDNPKIHVRIEGHTDSRGSDAYNLRLSQGRANSVRLYLIRRGIDAARMEAKGYGESNPIASNRTRTGRAQNRRVEFTITKQ